MKTVFLLHVCIILSMADSLAITKMKSLFGEKKCIEGNVEWTPQGLTLITISSNPTSNNTLSIPIRNLENKREKTPMALIHQLANQNNIEYQYHLTNEQGREHKKLFTVTLQLGNEEHKGKGKSMKKAKHSAAATALQQTSFKFPPAKRNTGMVNPSVELNGLAMKRGERTIYTLENRTPNLSNQNYVAQPNYYPKHTIHPGRYNFTTNYYPLDENRYVKQHTSGGPFYIRLHVGVREYSGTGSTVQAARHDAAAKAIEYIKQNEMGITQECPAIIGDNVVPEVDVCQQSESDLNPKWMFPISLVYEIALERNLNVAFEVLSEHGSSQKKVFVTQCRVGDLIANGEGNSKKNSKKLAAEKMLDELSKFEPLPNTSKNKKKQTNLIKRNTEISSVVAEEINPIERLIQIQQTNKENEPVYKMVEERDCPQRREFVIEASVNGHVATGVGPNKKIAKRNAAENLLTLLGYSNISAILPKPTIKTKKKIKPVMKPRKVTVMKENIDTNIPKSVRGKDQLLHLTQLLGVEIQFFDFPDHKVFFTLVSLSTIPPMVCYGEGSTKEMSHEKAVLEALSVLSDKKLDNVTPKRESDNPDSHHDDSGNKPQVVPKSGLTQSGEENSK